MPASVVMQHVPKLCEFERARAGLAKFASDRSARRQADEVEEADAQMSMSVDVESRNAGERIVSFLEKARTDKKAAEAVKKVIRNSPGPEALGVALGHLAGRGLAHCVKMLIDSGALLNIQDPRQPVGRSTPLQLAASRGHVNAVRLLVEAGADKTGGVEAAQELSKLGAVFNEEKKAILSILNG
eukprot:symbB.v1.2.012502.t1/scaffold862.1/size157115/11